MTDPSQGRPVSRAEFRKEVLAALRAAGLEGPFEREGKGDHLLHVGDGAFDLRETYDNLSKMPAEKRAEILARLAQGFAKAPPVPATWDAAKEVVLSDVKPRIAVAADDFRRARGATGMPSPIAEVTPHLTFQLVIPQTKLRQAILPAEALSRWGVEPDAAYRVAFQNLKKRPDTGWGMSAEAPGAYFSTWNDGFDAARLGLPMVFARAPMKGRPVALAPSPSALAFAGYDDEEGLFHLARFCRRLYEQSHTYLFLRPIRMGADGESWEDWMPPKGHGAYEALRLLQAINEIGDYEEQSQMNLRAAEGKGAPPPLPPLELLVHAVGGEVVTMTRWKEGAARALPKADSIVLQRDDETLGIARWEDVAKRLRLKALPGYPTRYLASDFPEDWQLAGLDLQPWEGA